MRLQHLAAKARRRGVVELRHLAWEVHRKLHGSVVVSTRQGKFKVLLAADESIGRSLYCQREYELDWMSSTMQFLRDTRRCPARGQGTIVDIGANNGVTSIGMLQSGELSRAIAIEPEPRNFELLRYNVALNRLEDRIICLHTAVAEQTGTLAFELSDANFGDHRVRSTDGAAATIDRFGESTRLVITVPSSPLDDLVAALPSDWRRDIALVWIDVQGYEGHVFLGAKNLLSTPVPVVSEIWPYGIRRAGMTPDEFCAVASSLWTDYWVWRRGKFVRYPVQTLPIFFEELGPDGAHDNVVFTR